MGDNPSQFFERANSRKKHPFLQWDHKCEENRIGIVDKVDFVLAFYMVHEVPSQGNLLREIQSILNSNGRVFIIEPKFHVSKKAFEEMINNIKDIGFEIIEKPKLFLSRAIILKNTHVSERHIGRIQSPLDSLIARQKSK